MVIVDQFICAGSLEEVLLTKLILVPGGMPVFLFLFLFVCVPWGTVWLMLPCCSTIFLLRSRSRSYSPSHSRRYTRGGHSDDLHRSKPRTPKIEFITEFGGSGDADEPKLEGYSPPPSPPSQPDLLNRSEHSTFNSCKDRLDSLFSGAAYPFCYLKKTFVV